MNKSNEYMKKSNEFMLTDFMESCIVTVRRINAYTR